MSSLWSLDAPHRAGPGDFPKCPCRGRWTSHISRARTARTASLPSPAGLDRADHVRNDVPNLNIKHIMWKASGI